VHHGCVVDRSLTGAIPAQKIATAKTAIWLQRETDPEWQGADIVGRSRGRERGTLSANISAH